MKKILLLAFLVTAASATVFAQDVAPPIEKSEPIKYENVTYEANQAVTLLNVVTDVEPVYPTTLLHTEKSETFLDLQFLAPGLANVDRGKVCDNYALRTYHKPIGNRSPAESFYNNKNSKQIRPQKVIEVSYL